MSDFFSFIGNGNLLIDVMSDAGVSGGFQLKGNCTSLEIKTDAERKEQIGRGRENYGQVIASVVIPKPTTINVKLDQVDAELLAMAFSGENAALSQAGGTVTDQAVTAKKGRFVELGKINISDTGFVVTNEAASTTYVEGTDYEVNYRLGMLCALDGGAITDGQALKVDYTYIATTGRRIRGGTRSSIRAALKLDGINQVDGRTIFINVPLTRLSSSNGVDFLNGNWIEIPLTGIIEMKTGQTEAFTVDYLD